MKGRKKPLAVTIYVMDEEFISNNPEAALMAKAIGKANCMNLFDLNTDRVEHFRNRVTELNRTSADTVIVLINVDDVHGRSIADVLMPGFNWQEVRDRGMVPVARGLASKAVIQDMLVQFDVEACEKLKGMTELAVVVVDEAVAEVFPA